jgi:hypothetical protein
MSRGNLRDLYYSQKTLIGHQIIENEVKWACVSLEDEEKCAHGFDGEM